MNNFDTWEDLTGHVRAGWPVFYQAPLDPRPVRVQAIVNPDGATIHVIPPSTDTDPFDADSKHLDRFRYSYQAGGRER